MKPNGNPDRTGIIAALGAYVFWGLAPIYFKLIQSVAPLEIIAHRILWSIPMLAGFLLLREGAGLWSRMRLPRKSILTLLLSGVLVALNWLIFVWAVVNGQVLATSLGYFIGPLVYFLLGFLFLQERMTRVQTISVLVAASGTLYLGWFLGAAPWVSLSLAFSFGFYGLIRKMLPVGPMIGLLWETVLLAPLALVFIGWSWRSGSLSFGSGDASMDVLLVLAGLVTILPLVWFNVAARSLELTTLGFFQYIAPSMTFLLSVFVYGEDFTQGHAVAFGCIWLALAAVSTESVVKMRRAPFPPQAMVTSRPAIVLVHGLWFGAWAMAPLARRLRGEGFSVWRFNYRTTRGGLAQHARELHEYLMERRLPGTLHFVGHSLGGLVTLKMLAEYDDVPPGRVVLLGSPLGGSKVARKARKVPGSAHLLGEIRSTLERGFKRLPSRRETGMIAGSTTLGLGLLVGGAGGPGDGTVSISETRVDGLTDHLVQKVTHTGMLYSKEVAAQTAFFLQNGRFKVLK